jgi:hypothetical protein
MLSKHTQIIKSYSPSYWRNPSPKAKQKNLHAHSQNKTNMVIFNSTNKHMILHRTNNETQKHKNKVLS